MPSTRNPNSAVNVGPGRLPAGTVTASSLTFNAGASDNAALQAHITDPIDAHMASAIGQTGYGAANATWTVAANGTQSALTELFEAVNARSEWVLDANPANTADFVGPNAFINAMAALVALPNKRVSLFLRPGTYNWTNPYSISGVTITGVAGGADSATNTVIIQNTAGDIVFGFATEVRNLVLSCSGDLDIAGGFGIGRHVYENVGFDVTGQINIQSAFCSFKRCGPWASTLQKTIVVKTLAGAFNDYEICQFDQLIIGGIAGSNTFSSVLITGDVASPTSALIVSTGFFANPDNNVFNNVSVNSNGAVSPIITVGSEQNVFNGLLISGSLGWSSPTDPALHVTDKQNSFTNVRFENITFAAASTGRLLHVAGIFNSFHDVQVSSSVDHSLSTSPLIEISADHNVLGHVNVDGALVGSHALALSANYCSVGSINLDSSVATLAANAVQVTGTDNALTSIRVNNFTTTGSVLVVSSDRNTVSGISVVGGTTGTSIVDLSGGRNSLSSVQVDGTACPAGVIPVNINGASTSLDDVQIANLSGHSSSIVLIDTTAENSTVSKLRMETISSQTGAFFSIIASNVVVDDVVFDTAPTPGSSAPLIQVSGVLNVEITNVLAKNLASFNSALISIITGRNIRIDGVVVDNITTPGANFQAVVISGAGVQNSTVRNVRITDITNYGSPTLPMFSMVSGCLHCTLENIQVFNNGGAGASNVSLLNVSGSQFSGVSNFSATSNVFSAIAPALVLVDSNLAKNVQMERIEVFNNTNLDSPAFQITDVGGPVVDNDNIVSVKTAKFNGGRDIHCVMFTNCGSAISIEETYIQTTGAGTGLDALFVLDSRQVNLQNCVVDTANGKGVYFYNSGGTVERLRLLGGTASAGAGNQLFRGHGHDGTLYPINPMILRDCEFLFHTSNCAPATGVGAGTPVVFFGGTGDTVTATHGPIVVDGLRIAPNTGFSGNLHRDSVLVIDDANSVGPTTYVSRYNGVYVDLKEFTWSTTGAGRGTIRPAAAVVEVDGGGLIQGAGPLQISNLVIVNVKEGTITDDRFMLAAEGANLVGVRIDGPLSGVHGTGSFSTGSGGLIDLSSSQAQDFFFFNVASLKVTGCSYVQGATVKMNRGSIRNDESTSNPTTYLELTSGLCRADDIDINQTAGTTSSCLVSLATSTYSEFNNGRLSFTGGTLPNYVRITNNDNHVKSSRIEGTAVLADGGSVFYITGDKATIQSNDIEQIALGVYGRVITLDSADSCLIADNSISSVTYDATNADHKRAVSIENFSDNNVVTGNRIAASEFGDNFMCSIDAYTWASSSDSAVFFIDASSGRNVIANNTVSQSVGVIGQIADGTVTIAAKVGSEVTLTGLTGMTSAMVGWPLFVTNTANANNDSAPTNGWFRITEFISSSSVKIYNPSGVFPDANSGSIDAELFPGYNAVLIRGALNTHTSNSVTGNTFINPSGGGGVTIQVDNGGNTLNGNTLVGAYPTYGGFFAGSEFIALIINSGAATLYTPISPDGYNIIANNNLHNTAGVSSQIHALGTNVVTGNAQH